MTRAWRRIRRACCAIGAGAILLWLACTWCPTPPSPSGPFALSAFLTRGAHRTADPSNLLVDRFWQDRVPRDEWEPIQGYIFTNEAREGGLLAIHVQFAGWRVESEVFTYSVEGTRLHLVFPQSGDRRTISFAIKEHRESDFDRALDLGADPRKGGTPQRYLSGKGG